MAVGVPTAAGVATVATSTRSISSRRFSSTSTTTRRPLGMTSRPEVTSTPSRRSARATGTRRRKASPATRAVSPATVTSSCSGWGSTT